MAPCKACRDRILSDICGAMKSQGGTMPKALLAANFVLPVAIAAGVLALAVFIYGIVRKFTRVSWLSWQVLSYLR